MPIGPLAAAGEAMTHGRKARKYVRKLLNKYPSCKRVSVNRGGRGGGGDQGGNPVKIHYFDRVTSPTSPPPQPPLFTDTRCKTIHQLLKVVLHFAAV